jgi:hypothetical protein
MNTMPRLHLFEFEDFAWFPATLRDLMTDYLRHVVHALGLYQPIAAELARALERSGSRELVDLCSGGGGILPGVQRELAQRHGRPVSVRFTDLYPSRSLGDLCRDTEALRSVEAVPVDAAAVPEHLRGFRTMFSALHHFRPETARRILQDAVKCRAGIGIFETSERSVRGLFSMMLMPLGVWLFTPAIRPRRIDRFFFTYVVPLVPFFIAWDGVVSSLRTYSPSELRTLADGLGDAGYRFEIGSRRIRHGVRLTYLLGIPVPTEGMA